MATDNRPIADLTGAGSIPARGLIPPTEGYPASVNLPVQIDGKTYDVLSFNPRAAREIFGKTRIRLDCLVPGNTDAVLWAQVLQAQWKANLGIDLSVVTQELGVWVQSVKTRNFRHLAFWGTPEPCYMDPTWMLDLFCDGDGHGSSWNDPHYDEMLFQARPVPDPAERLARLAECERILLRAMPILPLCHDVQPTLRKPFLKGLGRNMLNRQQFKYAWIDRSWKPDRS
jgi:ABC-type transport system substrate-binding protein